jgi:precorrin-2 methylase
MTKESLTILSGGGDPKKFETLLDNSGSAAIRKMDRGRDQIAELLKSLQLKGKTIFCAQLDLEREKTVEDLSQNLEDPSAYFSFMLVSKRNLNGTFYWCLPNLEG